MGGAMTKPPGDMFCRKCDYPLSDVSRAQCPECGRGFDVSNKRTFRRRPRYVWVRRLRGVFLLLLVLYAGSYVWFVRAGDNGPLQQWGRWQQVDYYATEQTFKRAIHSGAGVEAEDEYNQRYINRPLLWHESPREVEYEHLGEWANIFFAPANWLDRRIRRDHWTHFGCERELLPLIRKVEQLRPRIHQSEQGLADLDELDELSIDLTILATGTPTWKQWTAKIAAHLESMIERYE